MTLAPLWTLSKPAQFGLESTQTNLYQSYIEPGTALDSLKANNKSYTWVALTYSQIHLSWWTFKYAEMGGLES